MIDTEIMWRATLMEIHIILDCLTVSIGSMMTLPDTPDDVLGEKIVEIVDLLKLEKSN